MGWLTWSYQLVCLQLLVLHSLSCANLCSHEQSSALLHFKQLFSFANYSSYYCYDSSYPKMKYWKENTDCCSWDGVTCNRVTGHVIGLDLTCSRLIGTIPSNTSLLLLSHLQKLNLAYNDFNNSQIPSDFARFQSLTHLNLSSSNFDGQVPFGISHLSKLVSLDLSGGLTLETPVMEGIVQNMTELEELILDNVNMSVVAPGCLTNLSSSLTLLSLHSCELQGLFPENIFNLPNLHTLHLGWNDQLVGTFPKVNWSCPLRYLDVPSTHLSRELSDSIGNLKSLAYLNIESCNFSGSIPTSIGNLTQLSYLNLADNNFFDHIPSSLSNLEQLNELRLGRNNFMGEIPDIFVNLTQLSFLNLGSNNLSGPIPSSVGRLRNLDSIYLYDNSLHGTIPFEFFSLPSLEVIIFNDNHLCGHIHEFQSNSLETINLSNNRLHGPFPSSIFKLANLTELALSSNNLSGTVEFYMFAKLMFLDALDLSSNSLSISMKNKVKSSFPALRSLYLSSCNISEFPDMKSTAESLWYLDLSNNKINGSIPDWLYNSSSLAFLNLSHNYLTGIKQFPWGMLSFLDLHSNLVQGLLPAPTPNIIFFSVSHNMFTGTFPSSICYSSRFAYVDLSYNNFYGRVPECLGFTKYISVLDLRMNKFHGSIPQTFGGDLGCWLTTLSLNGNQLEGPLPRSLLNCSRLEVVDVGNNMINDTFPHWLANLPQLQVLVLRSNRLHGPLGNWKTGLSFSKLRVLDISYNGFSGHLQKRFFTSFPAMMSGKNNSAEMRYMGSENYYDSMTVTMKGIVIEMPRILTIFTTMDLSCNKFQGEIPYVVGKLNSLKNLNFSYNNLTGHIPISLENLTELESLDLSSNRLEGEIPMQLTSLTFLSTLNLSHNQLEGPIPLGKQFNTFQNDSYIDNLGLCGLPLSRKCSNDEAPDSEPTKFQEDQGTSSWFDWKIIMMGYASGLVIGLSMGYIIFSTGKPWWLVSMVEKNVIKLTARHGRGGRRRN